MKKITCRQSRENRMLAKQQGHKFFEGRPCKACGGTTRYVSCTNCYECMESYVKSNKAKILARNRFNQIMKQGLVDPQADLTSIESIYRIAIILSKATGQRFHVDHIIPLAKGGVHHHENLQILTQYENCSKSAKILGPTEMMESEWRNKQLLATIAEL